MTFVWPMTPPLVALDQSLKLGSIMDEQHMSNLPPLGSGGKLSDLQSTVSPPMYIANFQYYCIYKRESTLQLYIFLVLLAVK